MSDSGAFTGAVVGAAVAMAAERERQRLDDEARQVMAFFDPKTADVAHRRAYAKAVFRIDGSGDDAPASREDRLSIALLMIAIVAGGLWGWFDLAQRMSFGEVRTFDHLMGCFFGLLVAFVGVLVLGLTWLGLRFVFTGRT